MSWYITFPSFDRWPTIADSHVVSWVSLCLIIIPPCVWCALVSLVNHERLIFNTQGALILEQEISGHSKLNHVFKKYKMSDNLKSNNRIQWISKLPKFIIWSNLKLQSGCCGFDRFATTDMYCRKLQAQCYLPVCIITLNKPFESELDSFCLQ